MFFDVRINTVFENNLCYNCATVSSIMQKILVCDVESYYENKSKIRNVIFIFQNQIRKKNWKNLHGFWKINEFFGSKKKDRGHLIIYETFFWQFFCNSSALLSCKSYILDIFICLIF